MGAQKPISGLEESQGGFSVWGSTDTYVQALWVPRTPADPVGGALGTTGSLAGRGWSGSDVSGLEAARVCRGIVQELEPEEKLEEVNLSSLDILVSRDEESSAFCLLHDWLTTEKEVKGYADAMKLGVEQMSPSVR
ncbi:uncharacterized protein ACDP82_012757 [Pangshura tecta]